MNKLKPVISKIVGPTQTSFQQGKRASDNTIIVQEIINHFRKMKGKNSYMLLKLDLKKAFDCLEWSFIKKTLIFFNLPNSLIELIMSCITITNVSILVNGTCTSYFKPSRGIRQGHPLSPYLFIMCMEMLSRTINQSVDYFHWQPIRISKHGHDISHLLFADDIMLLSK